MGGEGQSTAASKRREANRLAAARFRTRKKDQVVDLEGRVSVLENENYALKGEVRNLRGQLGIKVDTPIAIAGTGESVSMSLHERVITSRTSMGHADSPGMGSSRSLNSMGPGDEDDDDRSIDTGFGGSTAKKRRKMGAEAGASEEELDQLRNQINGYKATFRVMQEEIGMLKGKTSSVSLV
jgi:hypothetical protein